MVTPFTIPTCSAKVPGYPTTRWERAVARASAEARSARVTHHPTPRLYEDGVNVRRPVRSYLMRGDRASYELHILPWKGQQCTALRTVTPGSQLLLSYNEDGVGVGAGKGGGGGGSVVENKSPKLILASYNLSGEYTYIIVAVVGEAKLKLK